jgi:Lrp/AsnC family transcriptional regulator for asnA, asnC and gidA
LTVFVSRRRFSDEVVPPAQSARLDELDLKILRAFRFGARLSNAEIARQIDVSEGTVRRRIATLQEMGALKFVAITDPRNLGFNLNVLIGIKAAGDKVLDIAQQLAELPEVPYTAVSMGGFDIWITALLPSTDAWFEFRSRLAKIAGIRETETFHVTRVLKQNFDWVVPDEALSEDASWTPHPVKGGTNGS